MKKSQEIIGLPVFSIVDGRKIGQVKDLVINPEEGKVDFLMVSNGSWYVGAKVLPFNFVIGIGEHAVTTENENQLSIVNENPSANGLLQRNIEVKGNRVLTNKGNLIGIITEYEIDENSGQILMIEYRSALDEKTLAQIAAQSILTFGSDIVVVKEGQDAPAPPPANKNLTEAASVNEAISTPQASVEAPATTGESTPVTNGGANLFKEKQKQFILGKKVEKSIKDADGNEIIAEGTIIDEAVIALADAHNKFVELSQSAK